MKRPGFAFATRFRVRYSEIDWQKIVFNSRYLEYADVAITDYWERAEMDTLPGWRGLEFNIVRALVEYKRPFRLGDTVEAFARTARVGTSSLTTEIHLCHAHTGELHATIELVNVNVDLNSRRAVPLPTGVRERLAAVDAG